MSRLGFCVRTNSDSVPCMQRSWSIHHNGTLTELRACCNWWGPNDFARNPVFWLSHRNHAVKFIQKLPNCKCSKHNVSQYNRKIGRNSGMITIYCGNDNVNSLIKALTVAWDFTLTKQRFVKSLIGALTEMHSTLSFVYSTDWNEKSISFVLEFSGS